MTTACEWITENHGSLIGHRVAMATQSPAIRRNYVDVARRAMWSELPAVVSPTSAYVAPSSVSLPHNRRDDAINGARDVPCR